jgi:predicted nucleotidyltransferase
VGGRSLMMQNIADQDKPIGSSGYSREQTDLVLSVCLMIATRLKDMMDDFVIVGGLVPSLIIDHKNFIPERDAHVGTMDLDIGLKLAIFEGQRYEALTERLRKSGFVPDVNKEGRLIHQRWKLRDYPKVSLDFLIPPGENEDQGGRLKHIQPDFAAIITPGLELAFVDRQRITLAGKTPGNEEGSRDVWVCGAGAYIVLKALAFDGRGENKDAYDLYYVLRHYGTGIKDIADRLRPLITKEETRKALEILNRDFLAHNGLGPRRVAEFLVAGPNDDIQADVVGFVRGLLRKLE